MNCLEKILIAQHSSNSKNFFKKYSCIPYSVIFDISYELH